MREPYKPNVDNLGISNRTYTQRYYADEIVKRAAIIAGDTKRTERLAKCECVLCFTSGRVGGAMCTTTICGLCDEVLHFGSTCTDVLCPECAKKHGLCKHCGGDIDLKQRRKPWIKPKETPTHDAG